MKTEHIAAEVIAELRKRGLTLSTAESCTGGGIGFALTAVPGSSSVYLGGVVSYANKVKEQVLGVCKDTLSEFGAVSEETALEMAQGVRKLIGSDLSVSITGIAGPASDDTNKPVGLVYIAVSSEKGMAVCKNNFNGSREDVRTQSICKALELILDACTT